MTEHDFRRQCQNGGWGEPVDKRYPANDRPDLHTHDFDALVLVLEGELRMVFVDRTDQLGPGDCCEVPAGTAHSEQGGPHGAVGLLAVRSPR